MPTENRSSNTDPRDVFIRLNPLGLGDAELRKDSTGFEDQRTHSDYLLFLAGYRESHPEPQQHAGPESYPPCDYCGIIPDYHPWHGSGPLNSVESRHIHACDQCRGLLPSHPEQHQGEPVAWQVRSKTNRPESQWTPWKECCEMTRAMHSHEVGRFNQFGIMREMRPVYTRADPGEVERLRAALKFYADRDHFAEDIGSDGDSVSGEPANVLWHEQEAWFVEDGSIARAALERQP